MVDFTIVYRIYLFEGAELLFIDKEAFLVKLNERIDSGVLLRFPNYLSFEV